MIPTVPFDASENLHRVIKFEIKVEITVGDAAHGLRCLRLRTLGVDTGSSIIPGLVYMSTLSTEDLIT